MAFLLSKSGVSCFGNDFILFSFFIQNFLKMEKLKKNK